MDSDNMDICQETNEQPNSFDEGYDADMDCYEEGRWDYDVKLEGQWESNSEESLEVAMIHLKINTESS